MKKHVFKSFALITMLFSAMTLSAASGVDWSTIEWIGSTDANFSNKFKCSTKEGLVNIQKPFGDEMGIYMAFPTDVDLTCNLSGFYKQGASLLLYLSSFIAQETEVIVTYKNGSRTFWVYYADGTSDGEEGSDTEAPVLESVELFGAAQNFVLLTPTASDNKKVTAYLITPNGGAETEATLDDAGKIKISGLTMNTSYTYSVKAKDAAGNVSAAKEITFSTLDRVFCEEEILPNVQFVKNQKLIFTAKKVSDTETYFALTSPTSTLTSMFNVKTTNKGGGTLPADYVEKDGWTLTGNTLSKTVTWATYPTSPIIIAITANRTYGAGEEKLIGLSYSMDISNTCGDDSGDAGGSDVDEPETPVESTYCHELLISGYCTIYLTNEKLSENNYRLTIEGENLVDVHNTYYNPAATQLVPTSVTSEKIICDFTATSTPKFYTPLYIKTTTSNEVKFADIENKDLIWGTCSATPEPDPEEECFVNFALASNGASATASSVENADTPASEAIDDITDEGTNRWSSAAADPQTWTLDLGQKRIFNTIEIDWEAAYAKDFTIEVSSDNQSWQTIFTKTGQENLSSLKQVYSFDKTTARYVRFNGTARATSYGYSFYEFRVKLVCDNIASLAATPATTALTTAETVAIAVEGFNQEGTKIDNVEGVEYIITPSEAGTIINNIFTPNSNQTGCVTIQAHVDNVYAPAFEVLVYDSENIAKNKTIHSQSALSDPNYSASLVVDGNIEGDQWQGIATDGTQSDATPLIYDSWFVLDLGARYDIDLIKIFFEGARSRKYHIDFSTDATNWNRACDTTLATSGIAYNDDRNDLWHCSRLSNSQNVQYVRFYSTEAATEYGMKMFEFQVFGTASDNLTITNAEIVTINDVSVVIRPYVTPVNLLESYIIKQGDITIGEYSPIGDGTIYMDGLEKNTNYSFDIYAKDNAGNITDHFVTINFTTVNEISKYCDYLVEDNGNNNDHAYISCSQVDYNKYTIQLRTNREIKSFNTNSNFHATIDGENVHVAPLMQLDDTKHIISTTITAKNPPLIYAQQLDVTFENNDYRHFNFPLNAPFVPCDPNYYDTVRIIQADVYYVTSTTAVIKVDAIAPEGQEIVSYGLTDNNDDNFEPYIESKGCIIIDGLTPNTTYSYSVFARTETEKSINSIPIQFTTLVQHDGECFYTGTAGDGQTTGAGRDLFQDGYGIYLWLNDDKTKLSITIQLFGEDIQDAGPAYFHNYPQYDTETEINPKGLAKQGNGLYSGEIDIATDISNREDGIIRFGIKIEYPGSVIKVTTPEYFYLDGSGCAQRVFAIYHHDDLPAEPLEGEDQFTEFAGGKILQSIQYKRRMPSEVWETLSVPFEVDSVTAFDPATGKHVRLYAQYNHNGSTRAGNYWLRYFKTPSVTRDNFQSNWHDIDADNQEAAKPVKDKAYIIRLPNGGGYYNDKYIVFHGRGYQEIADAYIAPASPQDDYYSYSGNNTMMPQDLSSAYVLDNAGYYFTSSSTVTLYPFECSVNATEYTIARMPRIALNGRNNTTTDLTLLPTTDLQGGVIYSIFGAAVARFNTIDEYDQACQTLAAGVYVIVTPSATTKIQIP